MPRYKIELTVEGERIDKVRKAAEAAFPGVQVQAKKIETNLSRADRLAEASGSIEDAKSEVESLVEELQSWKDGLPENLQDGEKAEALGTAIEALESIVEKLDEAVDECGSVEFPGMMG